jgi:hypothetical protein
MTFPASPDPLFCLVFGPRSSESSSSVSSLWFVVVGRPGGRHSATVVWPGGRHSATVVWPGGRHSATVDGPGGRHSATVVGPGGWHSATTGGPGGWSAVRSAWSAWSAVRSAVVRGYFVLSPWIESPSSLPPPLLPKILELLYRPPVLSKTSVFLF